MRFLGKNYPRPAAHLTLSVLLAATLSALEKTANQVNGECFSTRRVLGQPGCRGFFFKKDHYLALFALPPESK